LQGVREQLERAFAGSGPGDGDLEFAIRRFGLPREPFDDLIEGVSWDIVGRRYEDREDLRRYCYRVASTVGLLCVRIFGCSARSDAFARELGIALQWTNILRDIGGDLERGRLYLPALAMRRHRLSPGRLRQPSAPARLRLTTLISEEAAYARRCFQRAMELAPPADRPNLLPARIMARVYGELLRRVELAGDAVLDRIVRVPRWRRLHIATGLTLAQFVRTGHWGAP
jgi:phytoene synthase